MHNSWAVFRAPTAPMKSQDVRTHAHMYAIYNIDMCMVIHTPQVCAPSFKSPNGAIEVTGYIYTYTHVVIHNYASIYV